MDVLSLPFKCNTIAGHALGSAADQLSVVHARRMAGEGTVADGMLHVAGSMPSVQAAASKQPTPLHCQHQYMARGLQQGASHDCRTSLQPA
jgi:hypothetical protein